MCDKRQACVNLSASYRISFPHCIKHTTYIKCGSYLHPTGIYLHTLEPKSKMYFKLCVDLDRAVLETYFITRGKKVSLVKV